MPTQPNMPMHPGAPVSAAPTTPPATAPDAAAWADWAFRCFVHVADAEPGLSVSDVEHLHAWTRQLMAQPSTQALAPMAQWLSSNYPLLWKQHVAKGQALDTTALRTQWSQAIQPHPQGAALRTALNGLLMQCAQPRPSWLSRLMPAGQAGHTPTAERRARLNALWLDLDKPAHTTATPSAPSVSVAGQAHTASAPAQASAHLTADPAATPAANPAAPATPIPPPTRWHLRCVAITDETPDMRTLVFRRLDGDIPPYAPGQFMTLELHTQEHGRLFRSYTLSSSPSRPHTVAISVKRLPDGRGSNWLHQNAKPGWEVQARGASGHFTCGRAGEPSRMLLLGAGSGMTPMMSMMRWLTDTGSTADVALVQSARTENDVVFRDEWGQLARHAAGPRAWHVVLGSGSPGGRRISLEVLRACVPDVAQRTAYLCGPQPYLDSVKSILAQAGVPPEQILEEQFAPAAPTAVTTPTQAPTQTTTQAPTKPLATPAQPGASTQAAVSVCFVKSNITVQAAVGDCLLEVAETHGIDIPSACRSGQCGTCWTPLLQGVVQVGDEAGTTQGDGSTEIATCISRLRSGPIQLDC